MLSLSKLVNWRRKTFFAAPSAVMELSPQSHYKNFPSVHLGDQIVFGRETSECFSTIIHDVQSTLNLSHVFLGFSRELRQYLHFQHPTYFDSRQKSKENLTPIVT